MKWKTYLIKDIDGEVLYSGTAESRRSFVETCLREGKNFDRADFSLYDLSRLDLTGMRARGACFDGADLRGSDLQHADFDRATFRVKRRATIEAEARLDGCRADKAIFTNTDLTRANFGGARLTHIRLEHAVLDGTVFDGATMRGAFMAFVSGERPSFLKSRMINADFSYSNFLGGDFRGADLSHSGFSGISPDEAEAIYRHFPDRSYGATFIGCHYDKTTVFSRTVPRIRADARMSHLTRAVIGASTLIGAVASTEVASPYIDRTGDLLGASSWMGTSGASALYLVGVVGALTFVEHATSDWLRDRAKDLMLDLAQKVRSVVEEAAIRFGKRANLVVAMCRDQSIKPLTMALAAKAPEAAKHGVWASFKAFVGDIGHVIVCDRRHLAMALGTLAMHAEAGIKVENDITVIQCDQERQSDMEATPTAMRFMRDGHSSIVWRFKNEHYAIRYDDTGSFESCWNSKGEDVDPDSIGLPSTYRDRSVSAGLLERAMLAEHKLNGFHYPRDTHFLRAGRNGSILVQRRVDRALNNGLKGQPTIIPLAGKPIFILRGAASESADGLDETPASAQEEPQTWPVGPVAGR